MIPASELRAWAKGSYPAEAATELLIRAFNGRFADDGNPWIRPTDYQDRWMIDAGQMTDDDLGPLSGGERRYLRIVRSLAGGDAVNLADDVPGLDRERVELVLAALAHAAGSHEHGGEMRFDAAGRPTGFGKAPGTLFPWPRELRAIN